jgi:hypothetical protein
MWLSKQVLCSKLDSVKLLSTTDSQIIVMHHNDDCTDFGKANQLSQIFLNQINKLDPSIFRDERLIGASTDLFFANKILGYNTSNLNGTLTFVAIHSRVFQNKY